MYTETIISMLKINILFHRCQFPVPVLHTHRSLITEEGGCRALQHSHSVHGTPVLSQGDCVYAKLIPIDARFVSVKSYFIVK